MKGLLTKDFLVLAKQFKLFLLIIPVMALVGGASIASIAILLGAALPMTALAYDEQSKWKDLAIMMPYSKKDLILSKYLLGYAGMAGTAILFLVAQLVLAAVRPGNTHEDFMMIYFSMLSGLFLIAVNTPILFKFGTQKGRFVFIAFMGLTAAGGSILKDLYAAILPNLTKQLPMLLLVLAVILNVVSVQISLHIKQA